MRQSLSCTKAKNLVADVGRTSNGGRVLNSEMIAFNNTYYNFIERKTYGLDEMTDSIAVCNQLRHAFPEEFLVPGFSDDIRDEKFFSKYLGYIPTIRDLYRQPTNITKVIGTAI
jgi:hypothetical protein